MRGETPAEQRTFGLLDHMALWGSLGITLYIMPFGSLIVPALSLEQAFLAAVVAALLGGLIVAGVAAIAAHSGLSTVELLAQLLGRRSTPFLGTLLLVRNVVWAALALSLIANSAELVSERGLGAGLRPLWVVVFGTIGLALVAAGPQFTVRKLLRRAGLWLALLLAAGVTLSAYMEYEFPAYLRRPAVGGWPSFWQAVDVMLIVPLLWLPLVADYARWGKSVGSSFSGTFLGLFVATAWLGFLGVAYLPAVETGDISGFVVGMQLGLAALVILLLLQADDVFANVHSAGVALGSVWPAARRAGFLIPGLAALALALAFDFLEFERTLLLLASLFVPLFGVLMADFVQTRGTVQPAAAPSALTAWALGFLLYHWISPTEVGWWQDAMSWLFADALHLPFPLTDEVTSLGAAIPSFLAGFAIHFVVRPALVGLRPAWGGSRP